MTFKDVVTLKNINFSVNKGEFVAIIGGLGSGKSSLIKAISGNMSHIRHECYDKIKDFEIP